jgi:type IV pilus assembly protein PilY1
MSHRIKPFFLALAVCLSPFATRAEDIDLFVDSPVGSGALPNVLIILDNTANWNTAFENEMHALSSTLAGLPPDKFNVGIMLSTETGGTNNNVNGGYVRAAIRRMTSSNLAKYKALFENFDELADKGNGGASGVTMAEAYLYFAGGTPHAGNNKGKTDFTGNVCSGCNLSAAQIAVNNALYALPGNALTSKSATTYQSPVTPGSCANNFIIYISNGPNQENASADALANSMLQAAGGNTTQMPISPTGSQPNPSDEWARFMRYSSNLGIITYVVDVNPGTTGQGPGWTALLKSMAGGDDGYRAVSSTADGGQQIADVLGEFFTRIQAVNNVFASVSLPVSVSRQGSYLNQVYIGMFRPDSHALPRWFGNLKQYRLGRSGDALRLQDADAKGAINSLTGFIEECAHSFWTPGSIDTYWQYRPQGTCLTPADKREAYRLSNFPDGNIVEKGGQGYLQRATTSRTLKTCSPVFASCTSLTSFDTGNTAITQALLGASSTTERTELINWARGLDVDDEDSDGIGGDVTQPQIEARPSVHGDVVHSQPVAINFGTTTSPKVVVFYGGNDGVFRAINGNRSDAIGGIPAGGELWSFLPPEFLPHIKRLRDNDAQVSYPNITASDAKPKPYSIDGPVAAHLNGTNAWIYAGMRRGGRALYAFNVDVSNPANVTLKWKRGCPNAGDDSGCSTGFEDIGQTWSSPRTAAVQGYSGAILLMGGGYDKCEDSDPNTCTAPRGNHVYVMDADTGAILRTFETDRSVIADVTVVTDATSGLAKYAYAADLGGNLYRLQFGTTGPTGWNMVKIASLGCATTSACNNNRKFMFAPDVVETNGRYLLLVGSGDREKPLLYGSGTVTNSVPNAFFAVQDKPTDSTWLSSEQTRCGTQTMCLSSLVAITDDDAPSTSDLAAHKGWYLTLDTTEQVVTSAITVFGKVTFSTHQPSAPQAGSCSSTLGLARVYNVSYLNAEPLNDTDDRYQDLPPVGLPPSPVAGLVTLDDGSTVPFCIGCDSASPLEAEQPVVPPGTVPNEPKRRVYWYIQK